AVGSRLWALGFRDSSDQTSHRPPPSRCPLWLKLFLAPDQILHRPKAWRREPKAQSLYTQTLCSVFDSLRLPPVFCTSAAPAPSFSTGSTPATTEEPSSSASTIPTSSATPRRA